MNKFWLVWAVEVSIPTKKHISFDEAAKEAQRLSLKHPGIYFNVIESFGHYVKQEVRWEEHD